MIAKLSNLMCQQVTGMLLVNVAGQIQQVDVPDQH